MGTENTPIKYEFKTEEQKLTEANAEFNKFNTKNLTVVTRNLNTPFNEMNTGDFGELTQARKAKLERQNDPNADPFEMTREERQEFFERNQTTLENSFKKEFNQLPLEQKKEAVKTFANYLKYVRLNNTEKMKPRGQQEDATQSMITLLEKTFPITIKESFKFGTTITDTIAEKLLAYMQDKNT